MAKGGVALLTLFALERRLFRLEERMLTMAASLEQVRVLLAKYVQIGNDLAAGQAEIAADVAALIEKIKAGAPDLLTDDELAAAEATQAKLQASSDALVQLGTATDATAL